MNQVNLGPYAVAFKSILTKYCMIKKHCRTFISLTPPPLSSPPLSSPPSPSLTCLSAEVGGAPRDFASAHHGVAPHHTVRTVAAPEAPAGENGAKKKWSRRDIRKRRKTRRGRRGRRTGGRSALWPQKRPQRRASPTSAGKSQVSRKTSFIIRGSMCNLYLRGGVVWPALWHVGLVYLYLTALQDFAFHCLSFKELRRQEMSPKAKPESKADEACGDRNRIDLGSTAFTLELIWH